MWNVGCSQALIKHHTIKAYKGGGGTVPLILHVDDELATSLPPVAELAVSSKREAGCASDPDWTSYSSENYSWAYQNLNKCS